MQVALVEEGNGTQTAWDYHQPGLVVSGALENGRRVWQILDEICLDEVKVYHSRGKSNCIDSKQDRVLPLRLCYFRSIQHLSLRPVIFPLRLRVKTLKAQRRLSGVFGPRDIFVFRPCLV